MQSIKQQTILHFFNSFSFQEKTTLKVDMKQVGLPVFIYNNLQKEYVLI